MPFKINTTPVSPQAPDPRTTSDPRTKTDARLVSNGDDRATSATVNSAPSDHALITRGVRNANKDFVAGGINNAGEARILDAGMAAEAANLTKVSTLLQASSAAIAQVTNLAPRAVLTLLKG